MKTVSYLALVTAVCIVTTSANAQCTYRLIDVGRPMGYLSGPCNGAALGYSGAYRPHPNSAVQANPTVYAPKVTPQVNRRVRVRRPGA